MKLWEKIISWLGLELIEEPAKEIEEENFRINEKKDVNIWAKNKYKTQ